MRPRSGSEDDARTSCICSPKLPPAGLDALKATFDRAYTGSYRAPALSDTGFQPFDAEGLDPALGLRFRFGPVGEGSEYPPMIKLDVSYQRPDRTQRHIRYGRFWERDEEPTDADRQVLMDWAKERLAADIAEDMPLHVTVPEPRHNMPRGI